MSEIGIGSTDRDLAFACATKVMGWSFWDHNRGDYDGPFPMFTDWSDGQFSYLDVYSSTDTLRAWNPLDSDSDCFMLVDAMEKRFGFEGHNGFMLIREPKEWYCEFPKPVWMDASDPDRRRAIVRAALWAVGEKAK